MNEIKWSFSENRYVAKTDKGTYSIRQKIANGKVDYNVYISRELIAKVVNVDLGKEIVEKHYLGESF